jgi:flagellar L-ring protein precursor FlgH
MHAGRCAATTLALLIGIGSAAAQDMRMNSARSLFADQKATRVGEAVTILIVESSQASNDAKTSASRSSSIGLAASGNVGESSIPDVNLGVNTGNSFNGEGGTMTRGNLRATLSARVDSVLSNGDLMIRGNRTIIVNNEEQTISIAGIVRPSDIQADNSVYSFNISDARIAFEGSGIVARAQGPGWITTLLHWLF